MSLSACDQLTSQELLDLVKTVKKQRASGSDSASLESDDPASIPQRGFPMPDMALPETMNPGDGVDNQKDADDSASRAIAEADLVQREGDRLYALSEFRGLAVIDIQDPDNLKIVGEYPVDATAFEMYVKDGIVTAMLRDAVSYTQATDAALFFEEQRHSALLVLDASNPAQIRKISQWTVPGRILDSRKVGEHLYVMSHENGSCWGCAASPKVQVASFSLVDPQNPVAVSNLELEIPARSWGPAPSLMSTSEHLYVALNDRNSQEGAVSAIRTIDISNPASMTATGTIPVAGSISNRWQMSEHNDVLRVVTQIRGSLEAPTVETFSVSNLAEPSRLGALTMTLPRPEALRSVRFDKDRGYAITFERTDPLFTLDLSDPSNPKQMGELEIPGWVYHMEPRGDRLLGIGFDRNNPDGSLNASLFDVSDMTEPSMLSRVHFGGKWANFAEGQNQIHKAFKIWDDQGLLAIPFQGYEQFKELVNTDDGDTIECASGRPRNGVMLLDWKNDALKLRGEAPTQGQAKRSLLHKDRLLAVSKEKIHSFDIDNLDKPRETSSVGIALNAQKLIPLDNGNSLRVRNLGYSGAFELDIVAAGREDAMAPLGTIRYEAPRSNGCQPSGYFGKILTRGNVVFVEFLKRKPKALGGGTERELLAFDISDPAAPTFVRSNPLVSTTNLGLDHGVDNVQVGGEHLILQGDQLYLVHALEREWREPVRVRSEIIVYNVNGSTVTEASRIARPNARYAGLLSVSANGRVSSWYAVNTDKENSRKIQFHWQELEQDGTEIVARDIEMPGIPLLVSPNGNAVLAVGFKGSELPVSDASECYARAGARSFDEKQMLCQVIEPILHRVTLLTSPASIVGSEPMLSEAGYLDRIVRSTDRAAFTVRPNYFGRGPWLEPVDFEIDVAASIMPFPVGGGTTQVLSIGNASQLRRSTLPKEEQGYYGGFMSFVNGTTLLRGRGSKIELFDLSDMEQVKRTPYTPNAFQWACYDPYLAQNDEILCPAGQYGIRRLRPTQVQP